MISDRAESSSAVIFEKNWHRYRTVMAGNLMYHREVYRELHQFLSTGPLPVPVLDVPAETQAARSSA